MLGLGGGINVHSAPPNQQVAADPFATFKRSLLSTEKRGLSPGKETVTCGPTIALVEPNVHPNPTIGVTAGVPSAAMGVNPYVQGSPQAGWPSVDQASLPGVSAIYVATPGLSPDQGLNPIEVRLREPCPQGFSPTLPHNVPVGTDRAFQDVPSTYTEQVGQVLAELEKSLRGSDSVPGYDPAHPELGYVASDPLAPLQSPSASAGGSSVPCYPSCREKVGIFAIPGRRCR